MVKYFVRAISYYKALNGHSKGDLFKVNHFSDTWTLCENDQTQAFMFGGNQILLITCPTPSLKWQHFNVGVFFWGLGQGDGSGKVARNTSVNQINSQDLRLGRFIFQLNNDANQTDNSQLA